MKLLGNKDKRRGIVGSILAHTLLIIAFLFMGLTYQDPPPAEEGISINFGFNDEGQGKIEPESTEEKTEIIEKEVVEEQIESAEEITTQNEIETPAVEKTEKKKIIKKEDLDKINNNIVYEIKEAADFALASPFPDKSELFTDVYL